MLSVRVLGTGDRAAWRQVLTALPRGDFYFLPEYHQAYELNGDGAALAFVAEEQARIFFYPFISMPLAGQIAEAAVGSARWHDLETVRYTGPLCNTDDAHFLASAWSAFARWAQDHRVVAEFVRYNPSLETDRWAAPSYRISHDRDMVAINLDGSEAEFWNRYPSVQRNMVRKALKCGLIFEASNTPATRGAFLRLHRHTMDRNQAPASLYFSEPFFDALFGQPEVKLFVVRKDEVVIATGLVFLHGDRLHYHFGNNDAQYRDCAPTNLLLHSLSRWGAEHGFRSLHLGGGRGVSPQDDLLRFKLSISRWKMPYRIGRRIHDQRVFDRLCAAWRKENNQSALPAHTFPYRVS